MATYFRLLDPGRQFLDANGDPYSGGKLQTWEAGTGTNKVTWQDNAGAASHANPIILDSAGRVPSDVWGTTGAYKLRLRTSADVDVDTWDNIDGINDIAGNSASEWVTSGLTPTFSDADTFTLAGDQTSTFHYGRRVKITDSGGTDYGFVSSSSYSDPTTTVNVILDSGSIDSGISAVAYGLEPLTNPAIPIPAQQSACSALLLANHTQVAAANVYELIPLDDVTGTGMFDTGSDFDITTNHEFVAPATGLYLVAGLVGISGLADGKYVQAAIDINGALRLYGSLVPSGATLSASSVVSGIASLTAADTIQLWGRTDVASGATYIGAALSGCGLRIARIG